MVDKLLANETDACATDNCSPDTRLPDTASPNTASQAANASGSETIRETDLAIEIYSDIICPWCYIGKRRFEKALSQVAFGDRIRVQWRPFELNPDMPQEGVNRKAYRTKKFGSWEQSQAMDAKVTQAANQEGLAFNLAKIEKTPNTFNGHRLVWYAQQNGKQDELVESLFRAYFCDSRDIGNLAVLVELGADAGVDRRALTEFLHGDAGGSEVRREEQKGIDLGINGVPAFISAHQPIFSGAQDPAKIVRVLTVMAGES